MKTKPVFTIRNRYLLVGDVILAVISVLGAYALRFELGNLFFFYLPSAYWMMGVAIVIKPVVYYLFGLYRRMWIYASTTELKLILSAVGASSVFVSVAMILLRSLHVVVNFPRSVLFIDFLLSIMLVGGMRFTLRLLAETRTSAPVDPASVGKKAQRVLVVGAGDAGALVVRELQKNKQLNQLPIGFLDDNPAKQKQSIYGVPVVGYINDLEDEIRRRRADQVVIAIPTAPGRVVRLVADVCRKRAIPFRTMPAIYELLGGRVSVSRLREVEITDLLRREPTRLDDTSVGDTVGGKVVLVTGAGGSIGSELCRQIARWGPSELILLGHGENSIFEAVTELRENFPLLLVRPLIADIREKKRMVSLFTRFQPDIVFHTAAHKHVPLMEVNVEEAVTNNIVGTLNVVEAAVQANVSRFVMISTDKAVSPVNIYGATKRIAEMVVLDAAERTGRAFSVVRFGNVLGSRGSVVPIFKNQINRGGPVMITHPDMKRFFMTIPEAVHLVLQASAMENGHNTYVLNMGEQVRILDLAEDLIRLSGLEPGKDIEIVFTGIRPGEKISEDLFDESHGYEKTGHPDIFRMEVVPGEDVRGEELYRTIDELRRLADEGDSNAIIALLDEMLPNSTIRRTPPPVQMEVAEG